MSFYHQPDQELTPEEKLLAAVIALDHRIPVGFQIGMPMHLTQAIASVRQLFTEHGLPLRDDILRELALWHEHAEQGLRFANQCDQLIRKVVRVVGDAAKRTAR